MYRKRRGCLGRIRRFVFKTVFYLFIASILAVAAGKFLPVYYTPLMFIRAAEAVKAGEKPKLQRQWTPIDKISPNMVQAVVASEDNLFMQHNGFSIDDIKKARAENKSGKRFRGGSTISQQTAKNVFLWPKRSWIRKGFEAYFTVLIELIWGKERIMEVYLNVIETGSGIYGAPAAAKHYFNTTPDKLSRHQAAAIAVCLPNPRRFNPAQPSSYIQRRTRHINNLMGKIGKVDLQSKPKKKDKK